MRLFAILCTFAVIGCTSSPAPTSKEPNHKATVMITNLIKNSGGSGTIISSSSTGSVILTNSHVCRVIEKGGYVRSYLGDTYITAYKKSTVHDLCLIYVEEDLKVRTRVANTAPKVASAATITGHPRLYPLIISKGNFSSRTVIPVLYDTKECTTEDKQNPDTSLICAFFGKLPVIKMYDSIVVGALIQPGSSGSGIYNEAGELSAVVFAGSGDIGYCFAVPYEYVANFIFTEINTLPITFVNSDVKLNSILGGDKSAGDLINKCSKATKSKQKEVCKKLLRAAKYNDLIYREGAEK